MILACNYEEVTALSHGARTILHESQGESGVVAAPSAARSAVGALAPRLTGDLAVHTLADQRELERAVEFIVVRLRREMNTAVLETHPAAEEAVAAYFDFAHSYAVLGRLRELGREMAAIVEVMTGEPPTEEVVLSFQFPE
ncbi:MAG: hypothetical protein WD960_14355 [Gemmatimonadota bacterium]